MLRLYVQDLNRFQTWCNDNNYSQARGLRFCLSGSLVSLTSHSPRLACSEPIELYERNIHVERIAGPKETRNYAKEREATESLHRNESSKEFSAVQPFTVFAGKSVASMTTA